jgi:uncharacterized protein with NRDE domain
MRRGRLGAGRYRHSVCLLITLFKVVPSAPLIVAANRDERYDRPAVAITTLRESAPRILGGRDEVAGGTWMAINEFGVLAALTNLPSPHGRDATKRSRGELPVALAGHQDAAAAVAWFCANVDPSDYNPCWLMVGDRTSLFYVDLTGGRRPAARELPAGSYVLENAPLEPQSAKARHVAGLITAASAAGDGDVTGALATVLRDHSPVPASSPAGAGPSDGEPGASSRAVLSAACVHADGYGYGTRSAMILTVGVSGPPVVQVADGPSCQAPLTDVGELWAR